MSPELKQGPKPPIGCKWLAIGITLFFGAVIGSAAYVLLTVPL